MVVRNDSGSIIIYANTGTEPIPSISKKITNMELKNKKYNFLTPSLDTSVLYFLDTIIS